MCLQFQILAAVINPIVTPYIWPTNYIGAFSLRDVPAICSSIFRVNIRIVEVIVEKEVVA
jgi:hypothetical protein